LFLLLTPLLGAASFISCMGMGRSGSTQGHP
jgi:hypothetical protein